MFIKNCRLTAGLKGQTESPDLKIPKYPIFPYYLKLAGSFIRVTGKESADFAAASAFSLPRISTQ